MRKRTKLLISAMFVLITTALFGCFATWEFGRDFSFIVPTEKYSSRYDKMFDVAVTTGVKEGFTPTFQDKKSGLITLERAKGLGTCDADGLHIKVQFGNVQNSKGFVVSGQTLCMNPMGFGRNIDAIKNAIFQATKD